MSALDTQIDATLAERGKRYGDFTDHARICQDIKIIICSEVGWSRLTKVQKQALEVITDKIARILSGDPNYADNWHDIQGYAKLVEDRLPKQASVEDAIEGFVARVNRKEAWGGLGK